MYFDKLCSRNYHRALLVSHMSNIKGADTIAEWKVLTAWRKLLQDGHQG